MLVNILERFLPMKNFQIIAKGNVLLQVKSFYALFEKYPWIRLQFLGVKKSIFTFW